MTFQQSFRHLTLAAAFLAGSGLAGSALAQAPSSPNATNKSMPPAAFMARVKTLQAQQQKNLANFDDLDFNVYSNQRWPELAKSHAPDIVVHNPDGKVINGLPAHVEDLKQMFTFAPDAKIVSHPIRIADGNYTAVQGVVKGTFSQPMAIGNGKTIPPTNRSFSMTMVTIGRWENGVMKEEWLYYDNLGFMRQIGVME